MMANSATIWLVIIGLGFGTFLIRFSFLGIIGGRLVTRMVPASFALCGNSRFARVDCAPLVLWPDATVGGVLTLYGMQYFLAL
jgi:branched-subunit amino acid transport protein